MSSVVRTLLHDWENITWIIFACVAVPIVLMIFVWLFKRRHKIDVLLNYFQATTTKRIVTTIFDVDECGKCIFSNKDFKMFQTIMIENKKYTIVGKATFTGIFVKGYEYLIKELIE